MDAHRRLWHCHGLPRAIMAVPMVDHGLPQANVALPWVPTGDNCSPMGENGLPHAIVAIPEMTVDGLGRPG